MATWRCAYGDLEASGQMRIEKHILFANGGDGH